MGSEMCIRDRLKTVAAQVEAGRLTGEEARRKSLPDDGEEMFVPTEATGVRTQEYEVLKVKLELQRLEMEAESRRIEVEARRADREAEARRADREAEAEARRADREAEIRKMELEAQLEKQRLEAEVRMAELKAGVHGELREPANENGEGLMLRASQSVDNSLAGRTKKFGDALRHVLPHMPSEHAELPQFSTQ